MPSMDPMDRKERTAAPNENLAASGGMQVPEAVNLLVGRSRLNLLMRDSRRA